MTTEGLVWGYFQGGSIVMQISIAMLIFYCFQTNFEGEAKVFEGWGQTASGQ